MKWFVLCLCGFVPAFLSFHTPALAQGIATVTVAPTTSAPTIDGDLTSDEWAKTAEITNFSLAYKLAPEQTEVFLTYDAQNLYLAFRCWQTPGKKPKSSIVDRDGPVYVDDAVELFIQPTLASQTYYQFVGNSLGTVYDGIGRDASWNAPWHYKAVRHEDHWDGELSIPWSAFGRPAPVEGEAIGFNACRDLQPEGATAWSPAGSFHDTSSFGRLVFSSTLPTIRAGRIDTLIAGKSTMLTELRNNSPVAVSLEATTRLTQLGQGEVFSKTVPLTLPAGGGQSWDAPPAIGALPDGAYTAQFVLVPSQKQTLFSQSVQFVKARNALTIKKYFFHDLIMPVLDLGDAGHSGNAQVSFRLLRGGVPLAQKTAAGAPGAKQVEATFAIGKLAPGEYTVQATAVDSPGRIFLNTAASFVKPPRPVWYDSKIGISDAVLAPWTPMQVAGQTVSCWGRSYRFQNSFLPAQIKNQGQDMLAAPMSLRAVVNGKEITWQPKSFRVTHNKPNRIILEAGSASGSLRLHGTTLLEYDGFERIDFDLAGKRGARLDSLTLEIPLKKQQADLINAAPRGGLDDPAFPYWTGAKNGTIPAQGAFGPFVPYVWLGNNDTGLTWFAESQKNWANRDENKVIEVAHVGGATVLRVHIVDDPISLDRPLTITFGLQATPVKKAAPRQLYIMGVNYGEEKKTLLRPGTTQMESRLQMLKRQELAEFVHYHEPWTETEGYPLTRVHDAEMKSLAAGVHAAGLKLQIYLGFQLGDNSPEYDLYKDEIITPMPGGAFTRNNPPQTAYICVYKGQWANFMLYNLAKTIKEYNLDGFYLDTTFAPSTDSDPMHDAGYVDRHGKRQPTHQIFAAREWMKRMATMARQINPNFHIDLHDSGVIWTPTNSFGDSVWNGEQIYLVQQKHGSSLRPWMKPDEFRAGLMGRQYGFPMDFLDYNNSYDAEAIAYLHDDFTRTGHQKVIWQTYQDFGVNQAAWLPYWNNSQYVTTGQPDIYASLFARKDKGVLVVVSNLGQTPATASIALNTRKLAVPADGVGKDIITGADIAFKSGRIEMPLNPWELHIIRINSRPSKP